MATLTPPGPRGTWLGGNLREFRHDRLAFLTRCARTYGDVVQFRFGPRRMLLVSHPDLIEDVLVTQARHFIKHFALRLNPLLLGQGLLTSEGDFWLRQRRLVQPAFNRSRIAVYAPTMVDGTLRVLSEWKPGETREIHPEMMRLTLAIAAKTLFDAEVDGETRNVAQALALLQENFVRRFQGLFPLPLWLPTPAHLRMRRAVRDLDRIIYGFIRQRRAQPEHSPDLLSLLLRARDEGDGSHMTDQQLRDEAMTLFLAGHETTALVLSWTWYLLAMNPKAEEALVAEVERALGDRLPTFDDWARLPYTEQVLLESMRLYSPAYTIGREPTQDVEIGGYRVPRGRTVFLSQWVVHRDPRFFPEPEAFRPDRWDPAVRERIPKFAYFPFGGGPRLCVGNLFAMMEMVLVLATMAQRFRFTLAPGVEVKPQPTFTLRPVPGVPALITRR